MTIQIGRREFITLAGSSLAWPSAAYAQDGKMRIVGVLWHTASADEEGPYFKSLLQGFRDLGYVEGRDIRFEHRFPNEMPERFKSMAAELASLNVSVLIASGNVAALYAKNATSTIPIVFMLVPDPVGNKLVDSLARPAGNVTGISNFASDLVGKRMQLLKEIMPGLSRLALLVNPNAQAAHLNIEEARAAAAKLGLTIQTFEARSVEQLEAAFDAMVSAGMQAVMVSPGEALPFQGRAAIAKLALMRRLALCAFSGETFEPGALVSYGTDFPAICRRAPLYVDKIFKGARPGELPVEGPTKFEFLINTVTAKAIGLTVPSNLLAIADAVIE